MNGYDVTTTSYSFTNKPLTLTHVHTSGSKSLTEVYTYSYDYADRLSKVQHKLDNKTIVTLAEYTYDDLGRVKQKKLGGTTHSSTYSYNIRSWLTGITGSKFTQTLTYNNGTAGYNGNITAMGWTTDGDSHSYTFSYDGLSRLLNATHGAGRFTEKVTSYDKNGNIKGLQRYGQTGASTYGLIDNLSYTLNGNQLNRVDDAVNTSAYNEGFEFKDAVKQANEYAYDNNGNLTKDLNKGIEEIQYNSLNLPKLIKFKDQSTITYTYAADGTKLRVEHKIGSSTTQTTYCSNVIYEGSIAKCLLTEEGYVSLNDNKYHYYLKDHQGNNRVVVDQNGNMEEANHYYPFGGVFANTGNTQSYKYNGKELDAKKGLNWYDYGARHYDAALGRFTTTDRFAEKYYSMSSYQYGANNPTKNIDVNGDSLAVLHHSEGTHMGMLIQNEKGQWQYYSINGNNVSAFGKFSGGRKFDDIAVGYFNSPQEFLESSYNTKGDKDDVSINSYGYAEGYLIPTTSKQDEIMRYVFTDISQGEEYDLINNNYTTAVQRAMEAVGLKTTQPVELNLPKQSILAPDVSIKCLRNPVPSFSFKEIIKNNPNGQYMRRIKKY